MKGQKAINVGLWVLQVFFGLFFILASGAPKFFAPQEVLNMPIVLSREFLIFIGTCEVLGGLGLILPGLTRRRPEVTPVAAFMLTLLTLCATTYQLLGRQPESAVFAVGVGLVCALIGYARW
ncbi:MAG TPA: DoxX family protein, partial [Chloroflexota bacterium]|nr:DoxX family protein [Chloroflexota bacterium]